MSQEDDCSCILNRLEGTKVTDIEAREEEITAIKAKDDLCVDKSVYPPNISGRY